MYTIIYNPLSGTFSEKVLNTIVEMLKGRGHDCALRPTQYHGHATELAAEAVREGAKGVISYGGDGTANEVLNGMVGGDVPLLIAPSGTGNDMIRTLKLPPDPVRALEMQLDGNICRMDAIQINDRWCMNVAGLGVDVTVLREYEALRGKMHNGVAYKLAILLTLKKFHAEKMRMSVDGGAFKDIAFTFLSFGNGIYLGSGMKCVPSADPFDGILDVMMVKPLCVPLIMCILPLFFAGLHTKLPPVTNMRVKHVVLESDQPFWMQMDGEIHHMDRADIHLRPAAVCMQLPR